MYDCTAAHGTGVNALASVVIPAHDEERTISRTLTALYDGLEPDDLEVVVVCNGCTDGTAGRARAAAPTARILELPVPSKVAAVRAGNAVATVFPRVHLDADVSISGRSVRALVAALGDGIHATAPERDLPLDGASWVVRSYYRVWEQLPAVQEGLFGRGVLALSEEGQRRVDALPAVMSDDLATSEAFADGERRVVTGATAEVRPPRTTADLIRRRVRVATGNTQAAGLGVGRRGATTPSVLVRVALRDPRVGVRVPVFLAVVLAARWWARRAVRAGDFTTWLRDESSRA